MRLGLFGGTFDPVHLGHLILAEITLEKMGLDQICFLPSGSPPHKQKEEISSEKARTEMLEFAIAGDNRFSINRMEFEREGPTYTYETVKILKEENPEDEFFFIIGADSLKDFPRWKHPERIVEKATIVAVNRGLLSQDEMQELKSKLPEDLMNHVEIISMPGIDLSSTEIRNRVKEGKSIRYMVPHAVDAYIHQHKLYQD